MKPAWEHIGRYTTSIQQVGTRETLASAIKTDAFKWTWDSWTHYDWTLRGGGWSWSGLVAGSDLCWLQGGGCDVRDGGWNGSCNATSFS